MICDPCAAMADAVKAGHLEDRGVRCEHCWTSVRVRKNGTPHKHFNSLNMDPKRPCKGKEVVYIGHEYCEGCDCHHKPVGTGQVTRESE